MTVRLGPFLLVNPPSGQEQTIRAAYDAIDFPWELLADAVADDSDRAVLVEWDDTGQGVSGRFYGYGLRIILSTNANHLGAGAAFVFAHEVGHLIDRATLTDAGRAAIIALFHEPPFVQIGHFDHDHPDADHNSEEWANSTDAYTSRIYECYADQFVAAFAPTIWDGTVLDGAGQHWPRFVHWTDDHDQIRRITLEAVVPEPVPEPEPVAGRHPHPRMRATIRRQRRIIRRLRRRLRRRH